MLRTKDFTGSKLFATDGEVGSCADFLFDDETWKLRYLVANTGTWLTKQKVLILPKSLNWPDPEDRGLPVALSKEEVQAAPSLHSDAPVSQQYEMTWYGHHGLPSYWTELRSQDAYLQAQAMEVAQESIDYDESLRSFNEMCGYEVADFSPQNHGEVLGYVDDFILNEATWTVQYAVVETAKGWSANRKVLVAPDWLMNVGWAEKKLYIDLSGKEIADCPSFNPIRI